MKAVKARDSIKIVGVVEMMKTIKAMKKMKRVEKFMFFKFFVFPVFSKRYLFVILALLLIGCASSTPEIAQPVTQVIEKPVVVQPPDLKINYQFSYGNNAALKKAYQQYMKTGKAPDVITDGFEQFAYGTGQQPIITASPFELTVISLEPGENVTNVSSGDPLRWSYSMAYSGQTKLRQAHIMIKPSQANISTDLVITTDKRLYTLKLVTSDAGKYVRDVRFWYPEEMQEYWNNYNVKETEKLTREDKIAELPNLDVSALNFNYKFGHSGWSTPSWHPVRAFDDGTHTYIQFPAALSSRDMPVLFVVNGDNKELVNYRSKPPYFVVDKIFQKALLVSGGDQTVIITNNHY